MRVAAGVDVGSTQTKAVVMAENGGRTHSGPGAGGHRSERQESRRERVPGGLPQCRDSRDRSRGSWWARAMGATTSHSEMRR